MDLVITARRRSLGKVMLLQVPGRGGGGVWSRGGLLPVCLAGFQAHTQGGSLGRIYLAGGIWSRPTPKGGVEGDLVQAHTQGGS